MPSSPPLVIVPADIDQILGIALVLSLAAVVLFVLGLYGGWRS